MASGDLPSEEHIKMFCQKETEYRASDGYFKNPKAVKFRQSAINMIEEAYYKEANVDTIVAYLAINYFDCFLSRNELPVILSDKRENLRLLVVSCLTLALKTRIPTFNLEEFLKNRKTQITMAQVTQMESTISDALQSQLQPSHLISLVLHFIQLLELKSQDELKPQDEYDRLFQQLVYMIIIRSQADIGSTRFPLSTIIASSVFIVSSERFPELEEKCKDVILSLELIREEELSECMNGMQTKFKGNDKAWTLPMSFWTGEELPLMIFQLQWTSRTPEAIFGLLALPYYEGELPEGFHSEGYCNWRIRFGGMLNPVKDQNNCDMCWAIVVAEAVAVGYKLKHMEDDLLELASSELLDCCEEEKQKCYPYRFHLAFEWIKANGIRREEHYPFKTEKGNCRPKNEEEIRTSIWISGFVNVNWKNEAELMEAVDKKQPIAGGVNVSDEFRYLKDGIYEGSENYDTKKDKNGVERILKHAILITGYDTDLKTGKRFWSIKNSYGKEWGINGYGRVARASSLPEDKEPLIFYTCYPTFD